MNAQKHLSLISTLIVLALLSPCWGAGLLKPMDGSTDTIYMKSHHVDVTINNGFARTEVDQIFGNNSGRDLEATYSFPLPKQASLSELSLWIDGREVLGEVLEKQQARQVYQQQRDQGKDTALAEKNDTKTFDVKVSPVRAQGETRVRLVYYQPLEIDSNVGRYLYPLAEGGVDEEKIAFWSIDDQVHESFKFNLTLKSAFPVRDVRVPQYDQQAVIQKVNDIQDEEETSTGDTYTVTINSPEGDALTRDIAVYYRLVDDIPARLELIPYRQGNGPGTFMTVVTPAADLTRLIDGVDWTFVLDVSGSMKGGKIATLARGVSKVIGQMNPNDRYRIITFNNNARDFTRGYVPATPANVQSTLNKIQQIQANGGTNLFAGLQMAYQGLDADRTSGVLLATDGVANVGQTQHAAFLRFIQQSDIRLFTFVIGNSANQPLLERLARDSGGFAMNVSESDDIVGRIVLAKNKVLFERMQNVELSFSGAGITDVTPSQLGDLYQGQQLIVLGRYTQPGPVKITLKARICGQDRQWQCQAVLTEQDGLNPELERIWALSRIDEVMEQIREQGTSKRLKEQVIQMGTEYSLVTDYTSMVVLDVAEQENHGIQARNAERVQRERQAQQKRTEQPTRSHRVDQQTPVAPPATDNSSPQTDNNPQQRSSQQKRNNNDSGMFGNRRSPGFGGGTGPVGPLMLGVLLWARKKRERTSR